MQTMQAPESRAQFLPITPTESYTYATVEKRLHHADTENSLEGLNTTHAKKTVEDYKVGFWHSIMPQTNASLERHLAFFSVSFVAFVFNFSGCSP